MEIIKEELDRPWENLLSEVLALIFNKMSFEEILTVVPVVCKSWRKVAMQPECWQEIDIEDWCQNCESENMDRMVKMLVSWSVCVWAEERFDLCLHCRMTLRIPSSEVTDSIAIQLAPKFASLTYLDISYCEKMTSSSLEALGKHCQFLTLLDRNMPACGFAFIQAFPKDDEAFAIANYMCGLKHLELQFGVLSNAGMEAILSGCKELQHLDVRGCANVVMKDSLADQCQKLKVLTTPLIHRFKFDDFPPLEALENVFARLDKDLELTWEMSQLEENFDFN